VSFSTILMVSETISKFQSDYTFAGQYHPKVKEICLRIVYLKKKYDTLLKLSYFPPKYGKIHPLGLKIWRKW